MVAARCGGGLRPRELVLLLGDVHLYATHVEQAALQAKRALAGPFPALRVAEQRVRDVPWEGIDAGDFELVGYVHHAPLAAPLAV